MPLNVQVTQMKGVISLDWVGNSVCGDSFSLTRQELVPGLSTEEQPHEEVSYAKNIEKIQNPNACGTSKTGKFALTVPL